MERLSDTAIEIINELHTERLDYSSEYIPLIDAASRLSAYEDTGLEPEDLKKAFNETAILKLAAQALSTTPDHLRDLLQAEQDGRLVVLPCKVGDTIYYTMEGYPIVEPLKVRTFFVGDPTRRGEILHLHMIRTDKFDVSMDALGKTVFLTREDAEAALKGGEG